MMRPVQVLGLIAAGLAVVGAGVWLRGHQGSSDDAQDAQGPVLALTPADLNTVTGLRLYKGDGSHATLRRSGGRWTVVERGYAADSGQVRKLLLDLAALKVEEQKTADPALYPKLGVEDPGSAQATGTGVTLDAGARQLGLIIGHTSGTSSVYVRVAGQARSLLATPQLAPDADPRRWLDRTLLDIQPEQVAQVDVTPAGGPAYSLRRAGPAAVGNYVLSPLPKGREAADAAALAAPFAALAGLQLDDVRKGGAAAAAAHADFRTQDGLLLTVSGIQDGERRYVAVVASGSGPQARDLNARLSGWEFEVPAYRYETLFRPLEQLLKPRPAPASTSSPRQGPAPGPGGLPFGPRAGPQAISPAQSH